MIKIYNLKDKKEYLREVAILEHNEWGDTSKDDIEFESIINNKIQNISKMFENPYFCKLILLDNNSLIGFISICVTDGDERNDLSPWYATMYVKEEYRGNGYSKILNNEIIKEAKKRNIDKIYLKTELDNYYEKFGAKYMDKLSNGEKLYYIDIK